jgi:hypothetical protein
MNCSRRFILLAVLSAPAFVGSADADSLRTDLGKTLIPLEEIIAGGPPPDGIPPIDKPVFVSPAAADAWLKPTEPVLGFRVGSDARAYPLQILIWHEIVNDVVGGRPVVVTFCPLCNAGLVFDRVVSGTRLDFGTSGKLWRSDLLMYDRETHSLWSQMEGRAVVGARAGARLTPLPANTLAYEDFKEAYPDGRVLSRETGVSRAYGRNPYEGYDQPGSHPFLFQGAPDPRRPPKERVVGVALGGVARAYPWPVLARRGVAHDDWGGERLVVFYRPGALSALDQSQITTSRAVGATAVYSRVVDGRALAFEPVPAGFRDAETGSVWNLLGRAVSGPLAGRELRPLPHVDAFWFAWAAFHPATTIHDVQP